MSTNVDENSLIQATLFLSMVMCFATGHYGWAIIFGALLLHYKIEKWTRELESNS